MSKLTFSTSGTVYGEKISRREEDDLKLKIDRCMKHFHPFVDPSNYWWVLIAVRLLCRQKKKTTIGNVSTIHVIIL